MLHFLKKDLPDEIVSLIGQFEGRIITAYLREYVSQIYSGAIQSYHGAYNNLEFVTSPGMEYRLPFFAKWTSLMIESYPKYVKQRKCRKFMRNYHGIISPNLLDKIRVQIECCPRNYSLGKHGWKTTNARSWTF